MRFPPTLLDEIRARLPVSEVVGRRVKLKRTGREFSGLSPFNKEKTPSFTVNDQKGFYHDFSSGKHGDIFGFVMETEGVTFPEAVERLASLAGVPMPKVSREDEAREVKRKTLYDVTELAAQFFERTLAGREGAKARGYLSDRGISPNTQLQFRIGFAPGGRYALKEFLGSQGVSTADMVEAGLLIAGDDVPVPFDRFRDRVIFPITDWRGRVIAFGGRALEKDVPAKYLNSPETPLFHKGNNLYNGAAARQAAHDGARIIAVEGYVDVIAMVTAGYPGTVAPLGTALTEEQVGLLWRMADEPILCFDGDKAGRRAAFRALDLALPRLAPGKSMQFALLPEGQDPDDLARAGGQEAVEEVIASARPLGEMLWQREVDAGPFETPERRAALETRIGQLIGSIANESVRKYYRQDFEARLRALFAPPAAANAPRGNATAQRRPFTRNTRQNAQGGRWQPPPDAGPLAQFAQLAPLQPRGMARGYKSAMPPREALILLAVLNHPWLLEDFVEEFASLEFAHADADLLRRAILDAGTGETAPDAATLMAGLERAGAAPAVARVRAAITHTSDWPAREGAAEGDVSAWWAHVVTLHRKQRTLNRELKDAQRALADELSDANSAWINDIKARLEALEGTEAQIEGFGTLSGRLERGM